MVGLMFAEVPHVGSDSLVAHVHAMIVLVMRVLPLPLCETTNTVMIRCSGLSSNP